MFGFDQPEDGSQDRFGDRIDLWGSEKLGVAYHYAWWLVHNLVAHPLIGILPVEPLFKFHDWTSHRMHNRKAGM